MAKTDQWRVNAAQRRQVLAWVLAGCTAAATPVSPAKELKAPPTADSLQRLALLREGERQLANGHAEAARAALERAGQLRHTADTEVSLARTEMAQGRYRHALAAAAHAAAHLEFPEGAAVSAWLLHLGGQGAFAQRVLDKALAASGGNLTLLQTRQTLLAATAAAVAPLAPTALQAAPARMMPFTLPVGSTVAPPSTGAAVIASGTVVGATGDLVLCPWNAVATQDGAAISGAGLWVRSGLGYTVAAQWEPAPVLKALGLALLRLPLAVPGAAPLTAAARDPFAGSIATAVEYAADPAALPAWPQLHMGFLGGADTAGGAPWRHLGLNLGAGPRGGPLFNAAGQFIGVALPPANADAAPGADRFIPVSALRNAEPAVFGTAAPETSGAAATRSLAPDALYEQVLSQLVQIIRAGS